MSDKQIKNRVDELLERLDNYDGDNVWEDVVWHYSEVNDDECMNRNGNAIVLEDGREIVWYESLKRWILEENGDD